MIEIKEIKEKSILTVEVDRESFETLLKEYEGGPLSVYIDAGDIEFVLRHSPEDHQEFNIFIEITEAIDQRLGTVDYIGLLVMAW